MPSLKHGTAVAYSSYGCRCDACRAAVMTARRQARARRRERVAAGARQIVHGTWAAYNTDKCRCEECRSFKALYQQAYRARGGTERESA